MDTNETCKKCTNEICISIYFQHKFIYWTSGNNDIDKFIQDTQLSVHTHWEIKNALEWIPYDKLYDIKHIAKDEFGEVYRANWIDGNISYWNRYWNGNWERDNHNMFVILKCLNIPNILTLEFVNKV
jgi:hypothetical protein